jgi:hypothetical protein
VAEELRPTPELEQLIGKAIAEPDFRQQLVDDPEQAIQSAGIELNSEEMRVLTSTSREQREQMMQELNERVNPISGEGSWKVSV